MTAESKHPIDVPGYEGRLNELVNNLGNLDYRVLKIVLDKLGDNLLEQARADDRRGRENLADALDESARKIYQSVEALDIVCKICGPYMKNN